jgi:hypothetical protein
MTCWHTVQDGASRIHSDRTGVAAMKTEPLVKSSSKGFMLGGFAMQDMQSSRPLRRGAHVQPILEMRNQRTW